jgi:hypothetical protein
MLEDLNIDLSRKKRLLLSLLNARIALATLRCSLTLKGLQYPSDLKSFEIIPKDIDFQMHGLSLPCTGQELYKWARKLEKTVCDSLDSFAPLSDLSLPGHDSLQVLRLINAKALQINGKPVANRVLVMLDEVDRLTPNQRRFLLDEIIAMRPPVTVWIAERLEALDTDELLSSGALNGRDYNQIITIEDYWRGNSSKRFERAVSDVASRRARDAKDTEIGSFAECLQDSLDGTDWQKQFQDGAEIVAARVKEIAAGKQRYTKWIAEIELIDGSAKECAFAWRTIEILIERDRRKTQLTLDSLFDVELETEDLEKRDVSAVRSAAELLFCQEFKIPYYYGLSRLASMASSNIEQFLMLAGDLFEEAISAVLLKQIAHLNPIRQEKILKSTINKQWGSLPHRVKYGADVCRFLEAIGKYAQWETNKPNAPYAPGVTGIAISMGDRNTLNDSQIVTRNPDYKRLAQILTSCIAHNLLEVRNNQKCKGQYWIFYPKNWFRNFPYERVHL